MNYIALQNYFVKHAKDGSMTPTLVKMLLDMGMQRCMRDLRAPALDKTVSLAITVPTSEIQIPTDLIMLKGLNFRGRDLMEAEVSKVRPLAKMATNDPLYFCEVNPLWIIGGQLPAGSTLEVRYRADAATLANDTDSNFLSANTPQLVVDSAMSIATRMNGDPRFQAYEMAYQTGLNEINQQAMMNTLRNMQATPGIEFSSGNDF